MRFEIESPTILRIHDIGPLELGMLQAQLQYHDKRVDFELGKFKHSRWYAEKYGREAYEEKLAELKASRIKSLLYHDDAGYWTCTGLLEHLKKNWGEGTGFSSKLVHGDPSPLPWHLDPLKPYPYQEAIIEKMLEERHCAVEVATGLGKTNCLSHILRRMGLQAVVMAPSSSIAGQILARLTHDLGKRYVGLYGNGRHDTGKLITVATAQSLTRIEEDSVAWKAFSSASVFIADESHLVPAQTLQKVCFGLMAKAPYRFFFSGTQFRNDGLDLLLDGITGPVVHRMTVKEGIEQGYLAKLNVTMLNLDSDLGYASRDPNELTRAHLYYSPKVNRAAADMVNRFVGLLGKQVLVLVEELEQFAHLLPMLRHEVGFAHSGAGTDVLPIEYQKSDPDKLVERFNDGNLPILVGTSCIATGTDLKSNQATIYLRGGRSEIEVLQGAVGRSTRLHPPVGKTSCQIVDFDIRNVEALHRHAKARREIYKQICPVQEC